MKFTFDDFVMYYDNFFKEVLYSDDFDRYIYFFDRLISINKVSVARYKETDDLIFTLSTLIDNPSAAIKLFCSQPCDIMFDFYYRYQVLMELLDTIPTSIIEGDNKEAIFQELLIKVWSLGVPTFTCKNF